MSSRYFGLDFDCQFGYRFLPGISGVLAMIAVRTQFGKCWILMLLVLFGITLGCDGGSQASRIDSAWHRQDLEMHLSRWLAAAPTASGQFRTSFGSDWQALGGDNAELTLQARLTYVMARGFEHTADQRYREAMVNGADFLLRHYYDPVHGGFFNNVDSQGRVLNESKRLYGHAFALLALSHVARITQEERYRVAALQAWKDIHRNLRDSDGGYRPEAPRNFALNHTNRNQNPVMHLFEALLALVEATNDELAKEGARSVGNFVLYKLLQGAEDGSASIPEWYDEHWKPLPTAEAGGYTDLGHQFEWVHLLMTGDRLGISPMFGPSAERILKYALKTGFDDQEGGVFQRQTPDGKVDRDKYWWQQAEGIRACMVAAQLAGRNDLWRRYEQSVSLVKSELVEAAGGTWKFAAKRTCEQRGCSRDRIEPYHMVALHMAALELEKAGR